MASPETLKVEIARAVARAEHAIALVSNLDNATGVMLGDLARSQEKTAIVFGELHRQVLLLTAQVTALTEIVAQASDDPAGVMGAIGDKVNAAAFDYAHAAQPGRRLPNGERRHGG